MVALATTLAMDASIILLDEPFTNIDEASRTFLLKTLKAEQTRRHLTVIISDHDLHGYQDYVNQIVEFAPQQVQLLTPFQSQAKARQSYSRLTPKLKSTWTSRYPAMPIPLFN